MEKLKTKLKRALNDLFGERLKDGKCNFCGAVLESGHYCQCLKATKTNRYFLKANKKVDIFNDCFNALDVAAKKEVLTSTSKIPLKYRGMDFEDFKTDTPEREKVFNKVQGYFNDAAKNFLIGKNLILTGNFGTGKTLLMSILSNRLTSDYAFRVCYINAVDLINEIKDSFNTSTKITTKDVLNRYIKADFLFIDDIDKLNVTEYVRELMYSIINVRYENESPIIISSNNSIEVLDEKFFGEAVVSRLLEKSTLIQFNSKNARFE
jgi:DNA replication protein DnaC